MPALLALLPTILPFMGDILTRILGDPNKAKELELAIINWAAQQDKGQLEVNKAEAESDSLFKGGWRPFIGWGCGIVLIYEYGGHQVLNWAGNVIAWFAVVIGAIVGVDMSTHLATFPQLPGIGQAIGRDGQLWEILMGMLGLGGLRTYEKVRGVASIISVGGTSPSVKLGKSLEGAR